jgi:hypothetical protein
MDNKMLIICIQVISSQLSQRELVAKIAVIKDPLTLFSSKNKAVRVRFEFFTAVTVKNVVFWGIKPQFVPDRKHITSQLSCPGD